MLLALISPSPPAPGESQSARVNSCLRSPCCPAAPQPLATPDTDSRLWLTAPERGVCLAEQLRKKREGRTFFSTSVSTLGKMLHLPSRAELRGSRVLCPSITRSCLSWDFFSLRLSGKLSCRASCSAFPLFVHRCLLCQCKSGASALTSKEQAALSQHVCLRAESGPRAHANLGMSEVPAHLRAASQRLGQIIRPFCPALEEMGNSLIL